MKKYLILGSAAFFLMATTVYAFNDNSNFMTRPTTHNQNCPYHNSNENYPYYDENMNSHNCQSSKNGNCHHNNYGYRNGYGKQKGHHHNR